MPITGFVRAALAVTLVVVSPLTAIAQIYEAVGTRAQGMGGAFVAVADDATATWWNPAGMATGAMFSLVVDYGWTTEPTDRSQNMPGREGEIQGYSAVFPALGLSYYRLRVNEIGLAPATDVGLPDRQDEEVGGPVIRSLVTRQFGVSVDQSLGSHVVIASTLKLVRGGVESAVAVDGDPLKQAESLDVSLHTSGDLDIGAMASLGVLRVGVSIRNIREPEFGSGVNRLKLRRQARAGAAVVTSPGGVGIVAAFDADLTRTPTATGEVRHVAAGIESWLFQRRLGLRAGVNASTVGDASPSASLGVSASLRPHLYLDAAVTRGSDRTREGWAFGLSTTY